jgi:curved DNA-binding protein CbpA
VGLWLINNLRKSADELMDKDIFNDKKLLTRFIWKLRVLPDTPALIQFIAGDEDYLLLCSRIVNDSAEGSQDFELLKNVCLKQEFDFHLLKERLTPVARAFGLAEDQSNYYETLGVPRDAGPDRIKKAFRKRVIEVHPDTGDQISDSGREFINLKTAYQILGDPFLRQQYDENLRDVRLWKERAGQISRQSGFRRLNPLISQNKNQKQSARTKIYLQLGGVFLLLIIVVFIFDFIYRQKAILEDDYSFKQKQAQEQKLTKAAVKEDSAPKTGPNSSKAGSTPHTTENTRNLFNPDFPNGQPKNSTRILTGDD